ncbi:EGF-like repeat and discoidin I-like domain-containing protein 3 [Amphiura filiformis]|uniref:EGF-like repeat and discoidin I-like domain-containing protein 3 n=1 Tax=Amphiura filiformis TaxID=82378 RepID=UPI003B21C34E
MENGMIVDGQLSSSSSVNYVGRVRLNGGSSWRASQSDTDPWVQVTFVNVVHITAIATQGNFDEFVTSYTLEYLYQEIWQHVKHDNMKNGDDMIFIGHTIGSSGSIPVVRNLTNPIRLIAIRIRILDGQGDVYDRLPLRFELYGCAGTAITSCQDALGMVDGRITDNQLSASTDELGAFRARLFGENAWGRSTDINEDPSITVSFGDPVTVTAIATQGQGTLKKEMSM